MSGLDPALARQILQRVGEIGQPPEVGVEYLNVGNETLLAVLDREYLEPIATLGRGSSFKLVQAYFGGGKTHFLMCVRERAWRRGFCSALVGLSPDECPFDDPLRIYQAVARELSWAPGDPLVPPARGLEHALRVALDERREQLGAEGVRLWVDQELRRHPVDAPSYRAAVRGLLLAMLDDDAEGEELAAAWLRGEPVGAQEVRHLGVREVMSRTNAFRMLRSLCQVLLAVGAPGLLLCFDELDRNLSLAPRRRRAVADHLRQLIDLCGREALPGLLCLYAVPPEFMRHVVTEYPALQQRLEGPSALSERSPQAAVIDLERLDLSAQELLVRIGLRILELYRLGRDPDLDPGLQERNLRALADEVLAGSFEVAHRRAFVKAAVDLLHRQSGDPHPVASGELTELAGHGGQVVMLRGADGFEDF
ncbi:ATP-binding protein [Myxococcota bacterium]|nr:ATP-binding protein [Myxococcota bacterium]